jgi:hypothetical protein
MLPSVEVESVGEEEVEEVAVVEVLRISFFHSYCRISCRGS